MMEKKRYEDFDLLFERSGEQYKARVLISPAGQDVVEFHSPLTEAEIKTFLHALGQNRRHLHPVNSPFDSPAKKTAKELGEKLFKAVFHGGVLSCLRSSIDATSREGVGLRLRLRLADVPELGDLPWEYLYNASLNRFLALSAETPIVRYLDLPERIQSLAVKPPIRILAMLSSPQNYRNLDVEKEWAKLRQALVDLEKRGLVMLERLQEATLNSLQRQLRKQEYHILHFIGHGTFDQTTQDGMLALEDENQQGNLVSAQSLGIVLHDEKTLRLAVLNACEGARTSSVDPFAGTAQSLVQQGIPAVIAMQFEITDAAAVTFAHEFYGAVADGYPVDAALAEARKAIFTQGNEVEWGTPVLYMRSPDGVIFDMTIKPATSTLPDQSKTRDRQRLEQKLAALKQEWNLRNEKMIRLRKALAVENDVTMKFKLEYQFKDEEAELARLEQKIAEIEQE